MERVQALLSTYLFADLTPAAVEALASDSRPKRCDAGEYAFRVGDSADAIYVVASGQLKECVVNVDGEELVFEVFTAGAVFGEPGLFAPERNRVVDVKAMTSAELLVMPRQVLIDFATRHPTVLLRLLEGLAVQIRSMTDEASGIAYRPIRERLAIKLLELAATHGQQTPEGVRVMLNLPQADLAAMIGASRENVNRALGSLAAAGAVTTTNGRIRHVDPTRLSELVNIAPLLHRRNRLVT